MEQLKPETHNKGWIEVVCGSMFSGKTEELIRRLKRAKIARQKVQIFKPRLEKRYDEINVVSHDSNFIPSIPVDSCKQIPELAGDVEVIGIDEAQFFDDSLPAICVELANRGIRVIVAGLDMDFSGKPFGSMPALMAIAEYVKKVHAICINCGNLAHNSFRTVDNKSQILLGQQDSYVPLCRSCYNIARAQSK
jgi:thymidine kinase